MTSLNTVNPRSAVTPPLEEAMARKQTTKEHAECLAKLPERELRSRPADVRGAVKARDRRRDGLHSANTRHPRVERPAGSSATCLRCRGIETTGDLLFRRTDIEKRRGARWTNC